MMKIIKKQNNSKMCAICGLENPYSLKAPFYEMEDGSVQSIFMYKECHQSYPNRVHGGLITAMLDELGLRALWVNEPNQFGVTIDLTTKYRQPVPYDIKLKGEGIITKSTSRLVVAQTKIKDLDGNILAEAECRYLKLSVEQISNDFNIHEEMNYYIEDNLTQI